MSAIESANPTPAAAATSSRPSSTEVTGWLLEGRWFTIDTGGRITSWSPAAAARFGWQRKDIAGADFVETLLAPAGRQAGADAVSSALAGGAADHAGFTGEVDALDAGDGALRAAFALVPIQLSVGHEFNTLLQEISSGAGSNASVSELKAKHASVLSLIESALSGKAAEAAQTEEGGRLAGALVVFRAAEASAAPARPDNVVSIADAAGLDEARSQLDRSRSELEEARVEVRSLQGQLDEARREAQRARNEADVARQEAGDARDALAVSQREGEESQQQIDDARRAADEARAAAESARMRAEEAQRETERLRSELREARDNVRSQIAEAQDEVGTTRAEADRARKEAADARAEAARHAAEVEALRERLSDTQRELGVSRAEVEAARAELQQGSAISERRGSEAERLRAELEQARADAEQARAAAAAAAKSAPAPAAVEDGRLGAAFQGAPNPVAFVAPDGRFIDVNRALCDALGHDRDRLLSDDAPAVVHPDDLDGKRALAARMLAGEQGTTRGYRRYLHADGHSLTMHESVALLRDPDGKPELFVLQLADAEGDEQVDAGIVDAELAGEELVPFGRESLSADALREAIEADRFELHAQPVLDLRTNEAAQYELLIRMVGEDGRLVMPQAFLAPARRAGLAHAIDRWVVREAIRLLARTPDDVALEVNLSPEAVRDSGLPALIDEELAANPVDPARLVLEVTGATAADSLEETRTLAKRVRGLGCRFALDDFRSTFGSFRLLKDLPLDYLKLDGELVGSLAESRTSQLIVKALVDVAAGTGTKTVAVFVSDDDTLGLLRQQGVDFAQGYKVGRPKPLAEIWPGEGQAALPAGDG
jgi:PAS domain S-box-containing protein